jgi:hypothetical protein
MRGEAMLLYPLQGKALGWLLVMSAAALLFHAVGEALAPLGMLLGALWWLMAFKLAGDALAAAAFGREGQASTIGDGIAARQVVLGIGVIALVWGLGMVAGPGAELAAVGGLALRRPPVGVVLVMGR